MQRAVAAHARANDLRVQELQQCTQQVAQLQAAVDQGALMGNTRFVRVFGSSRVLHAPHCFDRFFFFTTWVHHTTTGSSELQALDSELKQLRVQHADEARRLRVLQERPRNAQQLAEAREGLQRALASARRRVGAASSALEDTTTRRYVVP